jgi:hypothetical protein
MTLSEYLQYVGITFPNDLPVREGVSDYGFQYGNIKYIAIDKDLPNL